MKDLIIKEVIADLMIYWRRGEEEAVKLSRQIWQKRDEDITDPARQAVVMKYQTLLELGYVTH
ncbi:hypothetical protein [Sanyastnella coralliicola]|uniref:hypothetical protein n=1 Tax=Sanyastnella coralliicola TaxID=3069118 RepID=UPI0027B9D342|nr:hypothetical protein [Longitalea sp. SCSIO 12813]